MHWEVFNSTPGLYPLEAIVGDRRHTQNIQINNVTGENEKCVFYFMEKIKWTFWPIPYKPGNVTYLPLLSFPTEA